MSSLLFSAYLRLEQLPDDIKAKHKIKIGAQKPRFDLTKQAGYYKPLEQLKNSKNGQTCFFLNETNGVINSHTNRAERFLQAKNSLNVSSVYLLSLATTNGYYTGYGYPNPSKTYSKQKRPNPFYECRNDGFLFAIAEDWKTIEVLVIPYGKNTIQGYANALADGVFREQLDSLRGTALTVYQY